jgi:circadian clock protein KaiC
VSDMLVRLIDMLKSKGITALFTALTHEATGFKKDMTVNAVSSLADIWIRLDYDRPGHQRMRSLYVVKARGLEHAMEAQPFVISSKGISMQAEGFSENHKPLKKHTYA